MSLLSSSGSSYRKFRAQICLAGCRNKKDKKQLLVLFVSLTREKPRKKKQEEVILNRFLSRVKSSFQRDFSKN
jgi:hypothetical protein